MKPLAHRFYIGSMTVCGVVVVVYLAIHGWNYYTTPVAERNLHALHESLSPVGFIGHGLGFVGTLFMLVGVSVYSLRKRWGLLQSFGRIKHVLEFHIFLCLLGPALIVYHTAFKFGGIVGLSFWCMILVVLSGVVGRYLYLQIPKTVTGREVSPADLDRQIESMRKTLVTELGFSEALLDDADNTMTGAARHAQSAVRSFPALLWNNLTFKHRMAKYDRDNGLPDRRAFELFLERARLQQQLANLTTTQRLFRHWHLFHFPLALIMLLITIAHTIVSFLFGYGWIFTD